MMALRRRHDVVLPSTDHRAGSRFPRIAFALPAAMLKRSEPSQLHREFFLAAKDFADASEVAAEA